MSLRRVVLQPRRARPFYGRHPWVYPGAIAAVEGDPRRRRRGRSRLPRRQLHRPRPVQQPAARFASASTPGAGHAARPRLFPRPPRCRRSSAPRHPSPGRTRRGPAGSSSARPTVCPAAPSIATTAGWSCSSPPSAWPSAATCLPICSSELLQPEGIYLRTERGIGQLEGLELQDGPLCGQVPAEPVAIDDDGLRFLVNLRRGTEDRLLSRSARQSPGRGPAGGGPARARRLLLHRRLRPARRPRRGRGGARRRCRPNRPWPWPAPTPGSTAWTNVTFVARRRVRPSRRAGRGRRALRPGRARSAEVRPRPGRRRGGAARLSPAANAWPCGCWSRTASW